MVVVDRGRPAGLRVLLQVPRSGAPNQSTPMVDPERAASRSLVIGVPLFFFLLWFVHRLPGLHLVHDAAQERDGRLRDGQAVDVEVRLSRRPERIGVAARAADRPVRLLMTSRDVIHSFYVPDFRIKQDVLPGPLHETWFEATKPGRYQILCAEYCGTWPLADARRGRGHAGRGVRQLAGRAEGGPAPKRRRQPAATTAASFRGSLVEYGKRVAMAQGCLKCHSRRRLAAHRPDLARPLPARETLDDGAGDRGRRGATSPSR